MKKWMLVLVLALLAGCTAAANPWEEAGVSEEFYRVAEDFSQRFLTLDADGARYDRALETIAEKFEVHKMARATFGVYEKALERK